MTLARLIFEYFWGTQISKIILIDIFIEMNEDRKGSMFVSDDIAILKWVLSYSNSYASTQNRVV